MGDFAVDWFPGRGLGYSGMLSNPPVAQHPSGCGLPARLVASSLILLARFLPSPELTMFRADLSRRRFLQASSAIAPLVLTGPSTAAQVSANARINLGFIGMGRMNAGHLGNFLGRSQTQVVAVCDVDTTRREHARDRVNEHYSKRSGRESRDCAAFNDFRELLARTDIDAVVIATPDHWHAINAIAAVQAGKDVYCEKPLTHNIHEADALTTAVRESGKILQTGSQQRSSREFRTACELVRNGVIGEIKAVTTSFGDPAPEYSLGEEPMEPGLDWDLWCGPGPLKPYNSVLSPRGVHNHFPNWRMTREYGGGMITDWGAHHIDIAQWGLGVDESGPVKVISPGAGAKRGAKLVYENGVTLTHADGKGVSFHGSEGEVNVNRGKLEVILDGQVVHRFFNDPDDTQKSLADACAAAENQFLKDAKVRLRQSQNHQADWLDALQSRQTPICDVAIGANSVISCHLMNLAYWHDATFEWDPQARQFASGGNPAWLTRDYRGEWKVG